MQTLFSNHIKSLLDTTSTMMQEKSYDRLLIYAGEPMYYYADDMEAPTKANPHFMHWCPMNAFFHVLEIEPGSAVPLKLHAYVPDDFWDEHFDPREAFWAKDFAIETYADRTQIWNALVQKTAQGGKSKTAWIGPEPLTLKGKDPKGELNADMNPHSVVKRMDWTRSFKTPYEVYCTKESTRIAAAGHKAAFEAFEAGLSEKQSLFRYLQATQLCEDELPYPAIVGFDTKAATLHYRQRRNAGSGHLMLIDAGARFQGYCSDITRTYLSSSKRLPGSDDMQGLIDGMNRLQLQLCDDVKPGISFAEMHTKSLQYISKLLVDSKILNCSAEEAIESELTHIFYPHGLGHMLGIQTHDVAGKQADAEDTQTEHAKDTPRYLRNLRTIEENTLFTIEPGLYFIPFLTQKHGDDKRLNHALIESLTPLGGIRVEDNILCTATGHENLTRTFLP